nr:sodium:alanine symporter family protein [Hyphomonas sp. Mor2]
MEALSKYITLITDFVWGGTWGTDEAGNTITILPIGPVVAILLGSGLYFMIRLKFRPLRRFGSALGEVWAGRKGDGDANKITAWQALSTALSGQVGTGNLAGVATAITLGGPGAIFWMWITAIFGMALAFAESSLAIKFRETDEYGRVNGGPMYYIKNGLGKSWGWLAVLFCIGTVFSATATGGMVQANSITQSVQETSRSFGLPCQISQPALSNVRMISEGTVENGQIAEDSLSRVSACDLKKADPANLVLVTGDVADDETLVAVAPVEADSPALQTGIAGWIVGLILAALVFAVIIGGIKSIGNVAGKVVPIMALAYVSIALIVLIMNAPQVPQAFMAIIKGAFGWDQAVGGFTGGVLAIAIRAGVDRGLFSNEAGQGSAPIAHAAAQTKNPVQQGEIAMIGVFIDTLVICTMTALVILSVQGDFVNAAGEPVKYAYQAAGLEATAITNAAYATAIPGGGWVVTIAIALFAFTTIIGWSYYAEQAITYLLGEWATHPIRFVWVGVIFVGALTQVGFVWMLGGLANATMAVPNLIAILALSGVVMAMHKKNGDPDTESGDSVMLNSDGQPYQAPAE